MMNKIILEKLFVYSENGSKYNYTEFGNGVNIIHGKNTSGKSTLIQSLLYVFGINDNKTHLQEILNENVLFRLDFKLFKEDNEEKISFIRDNSVFFIKRGNNKILRFNGINGNSSVEHIKLKEYINNLFGFGLKLESKNEYKTAPIEALFLPYYISQSIGWVYLHKSFGTFDYYRNFREDFLDYYLGIEDFKDRLKKQELEKKLFNVSNEIKFYNNIEKSNSDLVISKLLDENFQDKSKIYINEYKEEQEKLINVNKEYVLKCNELSYYIEKKSILNKIKKNINKQSPVSKKCPICNDSVKNSILDIYNYFYDKDDTDNEIIKCTNKINDLQSNINSLETKINDLKSSINDKYSIFSQYTESNITFNSWLDTKVNVKLINNITYKLGELTTTELEVREKLKEFKTLEEIIKLREYKSNLFYNYFNGNLKALNVKKLDESRFTRLYNIYGFPSQGVELHKTILAYYFALNKLVSENLNIHRFPFILDAIFKEDIDNDNKPLILDFIAKNKPLDTQLFISVAEKKDDKLNIIQEYNSQYFNDEANLICIGEGISERSFLTNYTNSYDDYLNETLNIINS